MDATTIMFAFFMCAGLAQGFQLILPCTELDQSSCIEHDSTSDLYYLGENITATITMRFDNSILMELWLDQRKVVLLTAHEEILNRGQEITDSQDRNRWSLEFSFAQSNSVYGKLILALHIQHLLQRDERLLHVEVRTESTIFKTKGKTWIPFPVHRSIGTTEQKAPGVTTAENVSFPDKLADLLAHNENLKKDNENLKKDIEAKDKYIHALETINGLKDNMKANGTMFPDIFICIVAICAVAVLAWYIYQGYRNYKIEKSVIDASDTDKWHTLPPQSITYIKGQRPV